MSRMASEVLSIGWKRQLHDQHITLIKHFLASNNSEYSCFRKRRQPLPRHLEMSQDFILICGEEGGEPCEVIKKEFSTG